MSYENTGKFRVNANGNQVDVWLIYQCSKCRHTYNLSIYERVSPNSIPALEYQKYLTNDRDMAYKVGTDRNVFTGNRAEIDLDNISFSIEGPEELSKFREGDLLIINNPSGIKIRIDKLGSQILGVSRSRFTQDVKQEKIIVKDNTLFLKER